MLSDIRHEISDCSGWQMCGMKLNPSLLQSVGGGQADNTLQRGVLFTYYGMPRIRMLIVWLYELAT